MSAPAEFVAPRSLPPANSPLLPLVRGFLLCGALACAVAVLVLACTLPALPWVDPFVLTFGTLGLAFAAATGAPVAWRCSALTLLLCALSAATVLACGRWGQGLATPVLALLALPVCMLTVVGGPRHGLALWAVTALALVAPVALPEWGPRAPGAGAPAASVMLLATQWLAVSMGLGCGVGLGRALQRSLNRKQAREIRYRRLLALATDASWEIDAGGRLNSVIDSLGRQRMLRAEQGLGQVPWQLPRFGCDAEVLDMLLADIESRRPVRNVPVRWTGRDGRLRYYLVSGEPRWDTRGGFTGYWGVARDVTEERASQLALQAVETRYQDLFLHIPTPLVLGRNGLVIDANPAAVHMFGHTDLASMLGTRLLDYFEQTDDSRARALQRLEVLMESPPGQAMPVAGFKLKVAGRLLSVRATGVLVESDGRPAVLSIFVDDTARLAADEAVRRSEALFSHLVATSPDLITVTELASGRYAMVNRRFEELIGWPAAEAVGRTGLELGVWADPAHRQRFVGLVSERGSVLDEPANFKNRAGDTIAMLVSAARFTMDEREYLVINARDVSEKERQRLEREAILNNSHIGIAVTRSQKFVLANPHFERILGWAPGELIGQAARVVWPSDADYAAVGAEAGATLAQGLPVEFERTVQRKDGSQFMARMRGQAVDPVNPAAGGTVWIVEDVSERHQVARALAQARDEAEAANRAKSAFLANTSHELRTPLNGMIGLARMAQEDGVDETSRRQYLSQIVDSAQGLAGIISDILDLSKVEAGQLQVENTPFDLLALLQAQYLGQLPLATARGLVLRLDAAPDLAGAVLGDPMRVRQVVGNFMSNALKFTAAGGVVLRAQRLAGGIVRLAVHDSGEGIDAATQARLFKPFVQADQTTTRRFGGTGLGLSICRELATLMGGQVGVNSEPGVGSTFWAELPLPATNAALPAALLPGARSAQPDTAALRGKRVLMVEDNAVNMMIAVALLERWGLHVDQAADGRAAVAGVELAAASGRPFDVVLMDLQMPVMGGHEATQLLRDQGHRMPVIALTAAALVSEREAALKAGMDDFLTKPVDADKLRNALQRWCARPAAAPAAPALGRTG